MILSVLGAVRASSIALVVSLLAGARTRTATMPRTSRRKREFRGAMIAAILSCFITPKTAATCPWGLLLRISKTSLMDLTAVPPRKRILSPSMIGFGNPVILAVVFLMILSPSRNEFTNHQTRNTRSQAKKSE